MYDNVLIFVKSIKYLFKKIDHIKIQANHLVKYDWYTKASAITVDISS